MGNIDKLKRRKRYISSQIRHFANECSKYTGVVDVKLKGYNFTLPKLFPPCYYTLDKFLKEKDAILKELREITPVMVAEKEKRKKRSNALKKTF